MTKKSGAITVSKAAGLNTQPNELTTPEGSLTVAENVEITRDGIIEPARGFEDFSSNIPDFLPTQIVSIGGVAYLFLDSGIWYYDTSSSTWLRKRGAFGTALTNPGGVAYLNGHLYVTSSLNVIYDINLTTGSRTVLAGRFNAAAAHTDGTGDAARFNSPYGITTDGTSLYVCDSSNNGIRKVTTAGVVTSLAGSATDVAAHTDGTGTAARFNGPDGITWDGSDLYVADSANNCIRKVTLAGVVTTPYGVADPATTSGHTDGTGNAARFNVPFGVTNDGTNLYVADRSNNCIRKVVISSGVVTTPYGVADPATTAGSADGIGNAARFSTPASIATDGVDLYVTDITNDALRKIYVSTGYVTTIDGVTALAAATTGIPLANAIVVGPS